MKKEIKYNRFKSGLRYSPVLTGILFMNFLVTHPSKDVTEKNFQKNNPIGPITKPVKNIVIVHGAFADGSGFKEVYNTHKKGIQRYYYPKSFDISQGRCRCHSSCIG
jgi:hypothetical protein